MGTAKPWVMKRLSIQMPALVLSAATLVAVIAPVGAVQASCTPVSTGDLPAPNPCQYVAIPQTVCRSAVYTVTTNPGYAVLPAQVRSVVSNAGLCEKVPTGAQVTGQDGQVFQSGNSLVVPTSMNVGIKRKIYVHNLDGKTHTFSSGPGCRPNDPAPCLFNVTVPDGSFGQFAKTVLMDSAKFTVDKTYSFMCLNFAGMTGTFTVTD